MFVQGRGDLESEQGGGGRAGQGSIVLLRTTRSVEH